MKLRAATATAMLLAWLVLPAHARVLTRTWLSATGSVATYAMSDVNADIGAFNTETEPLGIIMDPIRHGAMWSVSFGTSFGGRWSVGLGYDRLSAVTRASTTSLSTEYTLPGDVFRVLGRWSFAPLERPGPYLEASIGRVGTSGSFKATSGAYGLGANVEGRGLALELDAGGQYWITPVVAATASAGYRHMVSTHATLGGADMMNADGSAYRLDYSGAIVRAGVTLPLWQ